MTCPALPIGDDASLQATLTAVDCQLNAGVAAAYGRLFASGGALSLALSTILTIYVAVLAFGLLTGRTRLTLYALAPKATALCLVLAFATSFQAYHTVVHALLSGGPDQIAALVLGARGGATQAFATHVDSLFNSALAASQVVANAPDAAAAQNAAGLMRFSALELLLSTVGLLVVSRILLTVLLAIGPIFIVLALFSNTRGLFEAWLRTTVAFAFAPMLIVLGGGAVLGALKPIIGVITDDPLGAAGDLRPVAMLFVGVNVYALLVLAAAWTAVSLTRGWKTKPDSPALAADAAKSAADGAPLPAPAAAAESRASDLAAILMRERPSAPAKVHVPLPARFHSAPQTAPRRRTGLGHSFRKASA
jgi:type IV secretion system protein VirB6